MNGGMDGEAHYQRLSAAWRDFLRDGRIDADVVRPEVAASWRRCVAAGLDPHASKAPVRLTPAELAAERERNKVFIEAALPFMRFLETAVQGTGYILVLTDDAGIVLEAFGDERIIAMSRENNYVPGCCRSEAEVGTNAIGLALSERRPIQLTGAEHFNARHHAWTCASAPVFSPEGALLGTVTLSGQSTSAHRHTLGMAISAAEAIQNQLRGREISIQMTRLDALLASVLKSVSDALVTVDGAGFITHLNPGAATLLGVRAEEYVGRSIAKLFPGSPEIAGSVRTGRSAAPIEVTHESPRGRAHFMVTPYFMQGEEGGAILVVSERREFLNTVREISGFNALYTFEDIVGRDKAFLRQIELARNAARQDSRVLISGETGTGKELFAQAVHNASPRKNGPFVAINCAAIPRDLLESEIMGYKSGAFTGARKGGQMGKLELADGGTLFLDEIGQMPLDLQAKLLRVLQDGIITRLGDTKPVRVDARIIAATNEDLYEKSASGGFRQDLYFRLSVVEIVLPPLRERPGDLPLIAAHILERIGDKFDRGRLSLAPQAAAVLARHDWPGNIRELENVLEMAAILSQDGVIEPQHLSLRVTSRSGRYPLAAGSPPEGEPPKMKEIEIDVLRATMREFNGNIALVSRKLGLSRSTIYRRMKEHGITRSVRVD